MICKALSQDDCPALLAILAHYPALNWSDSMLQASLSLPHNLVFGLFKEEHLASFALFQYVLGEAELLLIATHPTYCKHGYARQLLQATFMHFDSIFLEVRESNYPARQLYECLGFEYQGMRKGYYSNPVENAVQYKFYI